MFWRTRRSRASRTNRVSIILAAVVVATVVGAFSSSTVAEGPAARVRWASMPAPSHPRPRAPSVAP